LVLTPMRSAAVRIGFVYPHLSLPALPALSLFSSVSLSLILSRVLSSLKSRGRRTSTSCAFDSTAIN
jgi:formate-dependent nitrite reductase membrane component NrfD